MNHESEKNKSRITSVPVQVQAVQQPAQFANHISVNGAWGLVHVEFSQALPPSLESEDQMQELVEHGIQGHVISRLLIPEEVFRNFILGMAEQIAANEDNPS